MRNSPTTGYRRRGTTIIRRTWILLSVSTVIFPRIQSLTAADNGDYGYMNGAQTDLWAGIGPGSPTMNTSTSNPVPVSITSSAAAADHTNARVASIPTSATAGRCRRKKRPARRGVSGAAGATQEGTRVRHMRVYGRMATQVPQA